MIIAQKNTLRYTLFMQKIFLDTRELDQKCREVFSLSEEIMMENASSSMELIIRKQLASCNKNNGILILCGPGNNGADGYALARRLSGEFTVVCSSVLEPKSPLCILQKERAEKSDVIFIDGKSLINKNDFFNSSIIIDCIFGSGFNRKLEEPLKKIINMANTSSAYKISCDVPTGLNVYGNIENEELNTAFIADATVTMGALKLSLFSDTAKDYTGKILVSNLGVSQKKFESTLSTNIFSLDREDLILPVRQKQNTHKGKYGHAAIVSGEKRGASVIAGNSALNFGSGLVTLVYETKNEETYSSSKDNIPYIYELMHSNSFPKNTSAIALGMGLGKDENIQKKYIEYLRTHTEIPCVLDADILYNKEIFSLLKIREENKSKTILTPHPKEFASLMENLNLGTCDSSYAAQNRFILSNKFSEKFPNTVLIAKGACSIIAYQNKFYICRNGSNALSKAGSGDVLAGITVSLLSQGFDALTSAVSAVLSHAIASENYVKEHNNFSLTPFKLIEQIAKL